MKSMKNNLKRIKQLLLLLILIFSTIFTGGTKVLASSYTTGKMIKHLNTDKYMYNYGYKVTIYLDVVNDTEENIENGTITFKFKHLES